MTKSEFVDQVADRSGLSKRDAAKAVDAFLDSVQETLKSGDSVTFTGFGKFSPSVVTPGRSQSPHRREGHDRGRHGAEVLGRQRLEERAQEPVAPPSIPSTDLRGPRERPGL